FPWPWSRRKTWRLLDVSHWSAVFQQAGVVGAAYPECPREGVYAICLGDPAFAFDGPILEVGAELLLHHPYVDETPDRPLSRTAVYPAAQVHSVSWERGLLIAVAAGVAGEDGSRIGVLAGPEASVGVQPPAWDHRPPLLAVPSLQQGGTIA